jgi:Putative transposase of IS4/5 family (DUF4096)
MCRVPPDGDGQGFVAGRTRRSGGADGFASLIAPFLSRGFPLIFRCLMRVDDRRVVSGIVYVLKNGLQWKDAPHGYGPNKTLYNRVVRWSGLACLTGFLRPLPAKGQSQSAS